MDLTKKVEIETTTTETYIDFTDNIKEWLFKKGYVRGEYAHYNYEKELLTIKPLTSGLLINICESVLIDEVGKLITIGDENDIDNVLKRLKKETTQAIEDIKELYDLAFGGEK